MSHQFQEPLPAPDSRFAWRLRQIRAAAGLTPHQVSERSGLTLASYHAYEAGKAPLTALALTRLTIALGVMAELFFDPD